MILRRAVPPALHALLLALAASLTAAPAGASLPTPSDVAGASDELQARSSALPADLPRELPTELPKECNGPFCIAPLKTRVGDFDLRLSCHVGGEGGLTCGSRRAYGLGYGGRAAERSVFTGHIFDSETGLYNAKARYFDPKLGRFLTQDNYLGQIDEPPSLHRYLYANANPTTFVDPTGHTAEGAELQGVLKETKDYFLSQAKGDGILGKLKGVGFGLLAGATGLVESGVRLIDEGMTATYTVPGIDVMGDPTGVQSREEIKQQVSDLKQTYHVIKEEGFLNAAGRITKNATNTVIAAAKGDPRAIAEVTSVVTEIAGPTAALKASGTVGALRRAGRELVEDAGQAVKRGLREATDHLPLQWSANPGANLGNLKLRVTPGRATDVLSRFHEVTTPWQRRVYQHTDFDWDLVRPEGFSKAGMTNRQAARRDYAPLRINPQTGKYEKAVLHHSLEDPRGALIETWQSPHGRRAHRMGNRWRRERPDWADAWNDEHSSYWRWRTGAYKPSPTDRLRLPGDE